STFSTVKSKPPVSSPLGRRSLLGKNSRWLGVRLYIAVGVVTLFLSFAGAAGTRSSPSGCVAPSPIVPGKFVDISEKAGVPFLHNANHTATKYQIQTMAPGVGL